VNTITNDLKECVKTARCADPEIDGNQQANLREQENMSTRAQTRAHVHERVAFDMGAIKGIP